MMVKLANSNSRFERSTTDRVRLKSPCSQQEPFTMEKLPNGNNRTLAREELPATSPKSVLMPDLSYLPTFNDVGGRPSERRGTHGSFTPGVCTMSGGDRRNVPLMKKIDPGRVLYVSDTLESNLSGEAQTNAVRSNERLGSHGTFSPGVKILFGGVPRDVPLETKYDHGQVLYVSDTLQPDLSGEAHTNAVRSTERLGSHGSFSPGVKILFGGVAHDVPLETNYDHGKVLFESKTLKPDLSGEAHTNAVRSTERLGLHGTFETGVKTFFGGVPRNVPLEAKYDHGEVLFVSETLQCDLSGEARTNFVRPSERLGSRGGFTPGVRHWLGGLPHDVPVNQESVHDEVLFVSSKKKPDLS